MQADAISAKLVGTKMCPLARRERIATLFVKPITRGTLMDAHSFKAGVEDLIAKVVGGNALDAFARVQGFEAALD